MNEHIELTILAQIHVEGLEYTPRFVLGQSTNLHAQCLLIQEQGHVIIAKLLLSFNTGRNTIYDRLPLVVFLHIDRKCIERYEIGNGQVCICARGIDPVSEFSPLVSDQLELTKAHHDRVGKPCHKHADKSNGLEIGDIAHLSLELLYRNSEQIPTLRTGLSIGQGDRGRAHIGNIIGAGPHVRQNVDPILKIFLGLIHCIVAVQLFGIWILAKGRYELRIVI